MGLLNNQKLKNAKQGSYQDGNGLILRVNKNLSKCWIFRYQINKKRRDAGLGKFPKISLLQARKAASEARLLLQRGIDPFPPTVKEIQQKKKHFQKFLLSILT